MGMKTLWQWISTIFESVKKARICMELARQGGQQDRIAKIMLDRRPNKDKTENSGHK
jgi:hypothetical protein